MGLRVPISKLRDLMSRKRKVYTDKELEDLDDDGDREPPEPKETIMESNGFKVGEHVVYPQHGVRQDSGGRGAGDRWRDDRDVRRQLQERQYDATGANGQTSERWNAAAGGRDLVILSLADFAERLT
jgi:hypothetical protein